MVYGELSKNRKLKISTIPKQAAETSLVSPLWLFISRRIKHSWSLRSLHGWLATKTLFWTHRTDIHVLQWNNFWKWWECLGIKLSLFKHEVQTNCLTLINSCRVRRTVGFSYCIEPKCFAQCYMEERVGRRCTYFSNKENFSWESSVKIFLMGLFSLVSWVLFIF